MGLGTALCYAFSLIFNGRVAQKVAQEILNLGVAGSIPVTSI